MKHVAYFALKPGSPPFATNDTQAQELNEKGHDIYWTVNEFAPPHLRRKENLVRIWAMYCESDNVSEEQMENIFMDTLTPSLVVRTKRGFHIYYFLDKPIDCQTNPIEQADWFRSWVLERLVPVFKADPQASDACRLLRPPMYRYWKDGQGSFYTDIVTEDFNRRYSLATLERFFPKRVAKKTHFEIGAPIKKQQSSPTGDFWTQANNLDVVKALIRLSGTSYVAGERYLLKKHKNGLQRLICNGRPVNVWIDKNGKIGSTDRGGPSIPNWLYWYHRDWKRVAQIIKEVFEIKEK